MPTTNRFSITLTRADQGKKHPDIKKIQSYLRRFGYLPDRYRPGELDSSTSMALKKFQKYMRLRQTGKLTPSTAKALIRFRCGNVDTGALEQMDSQLAGFSTSSCSYNQLRLSYKFVNGTADLSGTTERNAVRNAFETWSRQCGLSFREVGANQAAELEVGWFTGTHGDGSAFDGVGNVLAHAFYPPTCGGTHAGEFHFDDDETWRDNGNNYDVETVAVHEIGHLLGVEHSTDSNAIMFPTYDGVRRDLGKDDIKAIRSLYLRSNVHLHTMNTNGSVGARHDTHAWTEGWTQVVPYTVGSKQFLFLLKEKGFGADGNNVHIHQMEADGRVGSRVKSYKWTEGWTTTTFYITGGKTYLFMLKEKGVGADGNNVHIHRMEANGRVGSRVTSYKWTEGWTQVVPYTAGSKQFLFFLKEKGFGADGNNVHINKLLTTGKVGSRVKSYKWTEGWTQVVPYTVGSKQFLFLLKEKGFGADGNNVHINKLLTTGKVGSRVKSYKWTEGWTTATFYITGGKTYLFMLKETAP